MTTRCTALFPLSLALGVGLALRASAAETVWLSTWASSQYAPETQNRLADADLTDATLRQIVHLSAGGKRIRVHLSNVGGTAPLKLSNVHIAFADSPLSGRINGTTDHALTFSGQPDVIIPAGADYVSDPVTMSVPALTNLAVSFYVADAPAQQTSHPGSRTTSYVVHGNHVADVDLQSPKTVDHWYQLSAVDVEGGKNAGAIVALGDSITDGRGSTTNGNDRWTDRLAERLQAAPATQNLSVLNQGIGGNHLLLDGLGPNALARFDRDVIVPNDVRYLIVLEGINDLGTLTKDAPVSDAEHAAFVQRLIASYEQIVTQAHAHGIKVMGATILPYSGSDFYHPDAANEADRLAVNQWIRAPGHFDAVVDFDKVTADPAHPERLRAELDSGDHLHPSAAGYRIMGDAIPLAFFTGK